MEYEGNIPRICRRAQELLGYQFSDLHRHERMTADVDALPCRFGTLIATHNFISMILHQHYITSNPSAYIKSEFLNNTISRASPTHISLSIFPNLTTSYILTSISITSDQPDSTQNPIISSSLILFVSSTDLPATISNTYSNGSDMSQLPTHF